MVSNQQFRLKWNNHRNTVLQEFETLLHNNSFVDCTIGADGKYLKAHKIVLSACSPYLQNVFSEHFDKHPVILLKDVSFKELKCMIDYMYCGEVNISECELPSFLRTAQSLKIKGLAEDINEYDSASDNEHQEIRSLTENGRSVEPSVEIHDDEGPPSKRSAPSLIYSNFAGRKRKSLNAISSGAPKSSNNGDKVIPAPMSKTGGNVPSCADTDNSDSSVCTTSKDNNVNKDDNDKKSNSQDDLQEHKSKAVVKEEPLDGDDDNSSYEFVNNPCDDSDPLNEDSESNCANSAKNFNEVSIANVSSCNETEANDDDDDDDTMTKIKEELISEVVTISEDGAEEGKIRVRSTQDLMSVSSPDAVPLNSETAIYIVGGPACEEEIMNVSSLVDKDAGQNDTIVVSSDGNFSDGSFDKNDLENLFAPEPSQVVKVAECMQKQKVQKHTDGSKLCSKTMTRFITSGQEVKKMKFTDKRAKQRKIFSSKAKNRPIISIEGIQTPQQNQQPSFRKILPAPLKKSQILPAPTLLPMPLASQPALTSSTAIFAPHQNQTTPIQPLASADASSSGDLAAPTSATYRMIAVPSSSPQSSSDVKRSLRSAAAKEDPSQRILLSRVVLVNSSDVQTSTKQPVFTLPKVKSTLTKPQSSISGKDADNATVAVAPKAPAIDSVTAKFRKIAPLPGGSVDSTKNCCSSCRTCFKWFSDKYEFQKHAAICSALLYPKKGRKKNDVPR